MDQKEEKNNKLDSKELFKKCKQIIKQQKQQIQKLLDQNERLSNINNSRNLELANKQQLNKQILLELSQAKQKNQILHKQLTKSKLSLQNLTQKIANLQSNLKLQTNKIQYFQNQLRQNQFQKEQLQTKQELIEQTLTLMDDENQKLRKIAWQKQNQLLNQINQVKKLNTLIKRKNQMETLQEDFTYRRKINDPYVRPFQISNQQIFNRLTSSPIQNPQKKTKNFTSTDYKRSKSNSKSRDVGRFYQTQNQQISKMRVSPILQLSKNSFNPVQIQKNKINISQTSLQNELKGIKSSILDQYKKMQSKRQDQNNLLINKTLMEIQNKLQRMMKVTQKDQNSEDEI